MSREEVVRYYDYTIPFYKLFWHKGTNALHYGMWDSQTKTLQEALLNTNKILADVAGITSEMRVLDAGCGVGGSAIWLAQHLGAHVVGITVSPKQKAKAEKYATKAGVEAMTTFYVADFLRTDFSDNSFDVVWAIESVCHAQDKKDFLREAYRVLRPGGKLIIADGFLRRLPSGAVEKQIYKDFFEWFRIG